MKAFIKKLIPKKLLSFYHLAVGMFAALWYGNPSEKMIVIGVTGTKGKSSTAILLGRMLEESGETVGWATTATFKVGKDEWLNATKMTMLGRFALQALLARMVRAGCSYAIVETSSEGIKQSRHRAINYDVAVFTNLTPEHIESHGSFESYKAAKLELFSHLTAFKHKTIQGKRIEKIIVASADSPHASAFLGVKADRVISVSRSQVTESALTARGSSFSFHGVRFVVPLVGECNVLNIIAAVAVAEALGVSVESCARAAAKTEQLPGRMEFVQREPFAIVVDYAHEPASTKELYSTVALLNAKRVIQVFGSTGGGRDVARRQKLGELAGAFCAIVVVTTDDPYDDDPAEIAEAVARGAEAAGKKRGVDLYIELDRAKAIAHAISLAEPGDAVLITGKGSEQAMAVAGGKKIPWDDRAVARSFAKT